MTHGEVLLAYIDKPPAAMCSRCGRSEWDETKIGCLDWMTQPDGLPCGGTLLLTGSGRRWDERGVNIVMYCGACGQRFEGTGPELRRVLWPHHDAHDPTEFTRRSEHGEVIVFDGEPIVLSCNCGDCEFCRSKFAGVGA